MVAGPLGFVEAFERKIKEIEPWLDDESEAVREFAKTHIKDLQMRIEQ